MPTIAIRWADNTDQLRKNLKDGLSQIDATRAGAEKMVKALSGDKLIAAAHNFAAALREEGSVAKLTNAERERGNALLTKALEKYQALGRVAPQALHDLAAATAKVKPLDSQPIDQGAAAWKRFSESLKGADITNPLQAARGAVVALGQDLSLLAGGAGLAVAALAAVGAAMFKLAADAAKVGAELDDMADKTGVSVQALSRLKNAAEVGGTDMGRITDALFKLQKGLEEDSDKVSEGLKRIGLSTAQVKAAGPDKMLALIAEGFAKTADGGKRAAAATEIFKDRTGEMIPALLDLNAGMEATADIVPWTSEQAAAAEKFEQQVRSINVHIKAQVEALGRELIPAVGKTVSVLITGVEQTHKTAYEMSGLKFQIDLATEAWNLYAEAVEKAQGKKPPSPAPPTAPSVPGFQLPGIAGVMATDLAKGMELVASAEAKLNAEAAVSIGVNTRAAAARKQLADALAQQAEAIKKLFEGIRKLEVITPGLREQVGVLNDTELKAIDIWLRNAEAVKKFREELVALLGTIQNVTVGQVDVNALGGLDVESIGRLKNLLDGVKDKTDSWREAVAGVSNAFRTMAGFGSEAFSRFASTISTAVEAIGGLKGAFDSITSSTKLFSAAGIAAFSNIFSAAFALTASVIQLFQEHWESIKAGFKKVGEWIAMVWREMLQAIFAMFKAFGQAILAFFKAIVDGIMAIFRGIKNFFGALIGKGWLWGRGGDKDVSGAASGGMVTSSGIQRFASGGIVAPRMPFMGRDTVPIMASPGEMILTKEQQAGLGGVNVTVSVDARGAFGVDKYALRRWSRQLAPEIARAIAENKRGSDQSGAFTTFRGALAMTS